MRRILFLAISISSLALATCFENVLPPSKFANICPVSKLETSIVCQNSYAHIEDIQLNENRLDFLVYSSKWVIDNGLSNKIVSYDLANKKLDTDLINNKDISTKHQSLLSSFVMDEDVIYFSTYAVDLKGLVGTRKPEYEYTVLSKKQNGVIATKIFDHQVIQSIKADESNLYINLTQRGKEPYIYQLIKIQKNNFDKKDILYESDQYLIKSYDVASGKVYILNSKGKLIIKDKDSTTEEKVIDVNVDNLYPYYIKTHNNRIYIGYAKSFKDYSWADVGYVDISHSGIKKEHIKFMGLNMNNVFDSFAFDENNMYFAYKSGCIIRIENKSNK